MYELIFNQLPFLSGLRQRVEEISIKEHQIFFFLRSVNHLLFSLVTNDRENHDGDKILTLHISQK